MLELYRNETERQDPATGPVNSFVIQLEGDHYPMDTTTLDQEGENQYKACYDKLKGLPQFEGAVDV